MSMATHLIFSASFGPNNSQKGSSADSALPSPTKAGSPLSRSSAMVTCLWPLPALVSSMAILLRRLKSFLGNFFSTCSWSIELIVD